tara:strand:+ start:257 stop:442 length:186 start_codon:yes stop_codon:yes gene_type:complete
MYNKFKKNKKMKKDTTEVIIANGGVLGLSLAECNEILLFISTSLAICFTIYKFYKTIEKNK